MKRIKRSGFTIIEILLALIVIVVLALLLTPAFSRAREAARRSTCAQNMGQIHKAIVMYETDFETFPTRSKPKADPYTTGDAQEALNLLYRQYIDDVRVFSCPSKPVAPAFLNGVNPTGAAGWPAGKGTSLAESPPGVAGNSTSYGYSPGHNSANSRVVILADRQGAGPNGNSSNHGMDAGQNVLSAGGAVEFHAGKNAKENKLGKDDDGTDVIDSDIYKWATITPNKYKEWDSFCR